MDRFVVLWKLYEKLMAASEVKGVSLMVLGYFYVMEQHSS